MVTQELFSIRKHDSLQLLKTFPSPDKTALERYYDSNRYISHTDANVSIMDKMYQCVKKINIRSKTKLLNKHSYEIGKILDYGCGTGDFLITAKDLGWRCYGFEPNLKARDTAKQKGIVLANKLSDFEDHYFDAITLWHVLEHVVDLDETIKELKRILKPSGVLIIAVPNYKSFDAKFYGLYWAAYDVPRHIWHFSKTSISTIFESINMKLIDVRPMYFDSFYVSILSEKYKNNIVNYFRALYVGFRSILYGRYRGEYSSHIYILKYI